MKTRNNPGKRNSLLLTILLVLITLIKVISYYPLFIEKIYSRGIYLYISVFYRNIFGWLPVSIGDILYAAVVIYLLFGIIKFVKIIKNKRFYRVDYKNWGKRAFYFFAIVYIYFNICWGLNYNRPGIASQLNLFPTKHNDKQLAIITSILVKRVNATRLLLGNKRIVLKNYDQVFEKAKNAYTSTAVTFPFLHYYPVSIKRSLYGRLGNLLGFLGYYNPFTGEAQVNLTQPPFLIPFVACHEMGHQLGYASESEANFVGYLAAVNSTDTLFHYSAYFDLFNYANNELFLRDSLASKQNYQQLDPLVKQDEQELKEYWRKSDNAIEPFIKFFYDRYLKANQQHKGIQSYNEVIDWLIAYHDKYGKI